MIFKEEPKVSQLKNFVSVDVDSKDTEPALKQGSWTSVTVLVLSAITVFFPHLFSQKIELMIYMIASFILPLITAYLIRSKVWSPASVQSYINDIMDAAEEIITLNKASAIRAVKKDNLKIIQTKSGQEKPPATEAPSL